MPFATKLVAQQPYLKRSVFELATFNDSDEISVVNLFRDQATMPLWQYTVGPRSFLRWVAAPDPQFELLVLPQQTIRLCVQGGVMTGVNLYCRDWIDEEDPIEVMESWVFPFKSPAQVLPLDADNSIRARRQRRLDREEQARKDAQEAAELDELRVTHPDLWKKRIAEKEHMWWPSDDQWGEAES